MSEFEAAHVIISSCFSFFFNGKPFIGGVARYLNYFDEFFIVIIVKVTFYVLNGWKSSCDVIVI